MKSASPETFRALAARIKSAATFDALKTCEVQCTRHYENRTLTVREFTRLDVKIMEKSATITTKKP